MGGHRVDNKKCSYCTMTGCSKILEKLEITCVAYNTEYTENVKGRTIICHNNSG